MIPISVEQLHPEHEARFGAARDGVCVLGPDWSIRYANASLLEILRLLGGGNGINTLWDALPGLDVTPEGEELRTAMRERTPVRVALDPARAGGRVWEVDAEPLLTGELRVRLHNATQRVQREELARASAERARRLASAFDAADTALVLVEAGSWEVRDANPAALRLLGAGSAAVGRALPELLPGWDARALPRRLTRVASTGEPWQEPELRDPAVGAEARWFRLSVARVETGPPALLLATVSEVTREVRARRAADAERRALFEVLDALPVGVVVAGGADGRITYMNPSALEMASPADAAALLLPGGAPLPGERAPLQRALAGETVSQEELRLRSAGGAERMVIASATPLAGAEDEPARAVSVLLDLTDREALERALMESQAEAEGAAAEAALRAEESRALREIGRALVSEPEPERVLLLAATAAAELLGARGAFVATPVGPRRVRFRPAVGVLSPLDDRVVALDAAAFDPPEGSPGSRVVNSLAEIPAGSGLRPRLERLGVDRFAYAPMQAFGERMGTLGVVDREGAFTAGDAAILEALADSAALALHNTRLLAAERRRAEEGEALLGAAEAVISTLDASEVMRRIVAIAQRLTSADGAGITLVEGEARGRLRIPVAIGQMEGWAGMDGPVAGSLTERVLAEGRAYILAPEELPEESPARRALESLRAATYTLAPMRAGGEPLGVLGVVHERGRSVPAPGELRLLQSLADQAAMAIRNARLYEQAQAASRAKSQFLATVSHELRTPINALEGYASLLEDGVFGPVNDPQAHALGRMRASQRHLLALIEQVLDAARLEAGARRPQPADLDAVEIVAGVAEALRGVADRKGLSLAVDAPAPAPIRTDAGLLRQILTNVVGNALKFTDRGGVVLRVVPAAPGLQVLVEDTGPGIAPEHLEHIWEPFYQVEPAMTRREGGTGLGLALSREYARLLGGDLSVRSESGQGSTFTLTLLPLATPT